ncbi:MAG: translation initiation factor IF-2 [Lentisphaerae bacterium GWF2_44_16]|nr:MAG: translation initiation factor IF-2 [Lentisphaerae bacterium GWF2_44_16]
MAAKSLKVKDLADKYGVSTKEIIKELEAEGVSVKGASGVIPPDMVELIEAHFEDLMGDEKKLKIAETKKNKSAGEGPEEEKSPVAGNEEVHIKPPIVVKSLAQAVNKKPNEIITALLSMNILANINQSIEPEVAIKVCEGLGINLVVERREKKEEHVKPAADEVAPEELDVEDKPEDLKPRPPVITFLGHVDHGKTSLQDAIRVTNVAKGEHGGITQHIGASTVSIHGKSITFIDTPGHEAFTSMRARGANITDIAILVVAADDGFMPQTVEALNHALAAKVPVIVAANKIDLPDANPDKILLHMQQNGLSAEEWGGETGVVKVSAKTGQGIETLLERIILESEMLELKANPNRPARAVVLEAQLEQGMGPTANILVQNGTLKTGDAILCGEYYGKVKAMIDYHGHNVKSAGPSVPVKLVGLSGVPQAGSKLIACENEKEGRRIAEERAVKNRTKVLTVTTAASLEDIFTQFDMGKRNNLRIILKTDVRGSAEAIAESLKKLPSDKISIDIVYSGVGAITENDILLASASKAVVVGFHVRVNPGVNTLAKRECVEIRLYSIIYELLEDITEALTGRLEPEKREKELGSARILQIFEVSKGPKVCGCMVDKGTVKVGGKARVFRNNELIFNGEVRSLRRFQDDVKEVKQGLECGIRLDNFMDFNENDIIQIYDIELKKATL